MDKQYNIKICDFGSSRDLFYSSKDIKKINNNTELQTNFNLNEILIN